MVMVAEVQVQQVETQVSRTGVQVQQAEQVLGNLSSLHCGFLPYNYCCCQYCSIRTLGATPPRSQSLYIKSIMDPYIHIQSPVELYSSLVLAQYKG